MICPECNCEFQQGILVCSDCHVPLEQTQTRLAQDHEHIEYAYAEYEDLLTTFDQMQVSFVRSILEGEDIEYYVLGEHAHMPFAYPVPMIIRVVADKAVRAREILADLDGDA